MVLKKLFKNLTTPTSELDAERLRKFCESRQGVVSIVDLPPRVKGTVVGEITSLRIVPRAGSSSLEATITDGTGSVLVVWTGRRKIAGVAPGKRLVISGRGAASGPKGRLLLFNPSYELL
ncbi:MAG: OB-fold nucleic acid binding domain-containing protein [Acidimicrobiia bacterium]|nr:OB-fold nucleic acid binding domain-containing protein [Acidimicrobiia bacterium]